MTALRQLLAVGGGTFSTAATNSPFDEFVLELSRTERPSICFIPTASGDSDSEIDAFYEAFGDRAQASHLQLFRRGRRDIARQLDEADVIYVGGGNPANLLALWRLHGVDEMVTNAHLAGTTIVGVSAGASCLFEGYLTDSFGPPLRRLNDGLGLVPGTFCPHYASSKRRTRFREAVAEGFGDGYGVDSNAALHFVDGKLVEVVSARSNAAAYRVTRSGSGTEERELPTRNLEAR